MAKQSAPQTKYAIKLGVLTNSFYDLESKANLFKSMPYYFFNHQPTNAILNGVNSGRLIDLKGNIKESESKTASVDNAQVELLAKENEALASENARLKVELEAIKAENVKLAKEVEDAKSAKETEDAKSTKDAKPASKSKSKAEVEAE